MSNIAIFLMPIVLCLCVGAGVLGIGAALFLLVRRSSQTLNRDWGELGMTTGLTLKPGGIFSQPELNGQYRQRPIRLHLPSSGTQRHRTTYTAIDLTLLNPVNASFEITPSGYVVNVLGRMAKAQDIQIGNPTFDERFVVKGNPPEFAAMLLGEPRLQERILGIPGEFRLGLSGNCLQYSRRGLEENLELLVKLFNLLSDAADRIETPTTHGAA